jgi:hypothetical protein
VAPHFKVDAVLDQHPAGHGGDVIVHLTQTNIGPVDAIIPEDNHGPLHAEFDCVIHIHDAHGHIPHLTPYWDAIVHPHVGLFGGLQLKPLKVGEARSETLVLNKLFVLEPGQVYHAAFTVRRHVNPASFPPTSNWLTVTVE